MSISRGNWSSLSRMAQQWIEDDEEEQIRERRRRNRDASTSSRVVEVSTGDGSSILQSTPSAASSKENNKLLKKEQLENLHTQNEENTERPEKYGESNEQTSNDAESQVSAPETLKAKLPKSATHENQALTSKKKGYQNHAKSNTILNQTENTTDSQKECILSINQHTLEPKGVKGALENHQTARTLSQKFSSRNEKDHAKKVGMAPLQSSSFEINEIPEEKKTETSHNKSRDHSAQGESFSETFSESVSTTHLEPQNETNISSSHGSESKYKTQVFVSSVKIPRPSSSNCSIKNPLPVPEAIEEDPFTDTKAMKSVFVSAVPSSNLNIKQSSPPSSQHSTTSFVRLGPLSSSVRVKSQVENDGEDSGFIRRSSLRLSLRSHKLEDRMEKYTSAIQRSASVKIPPSHSRGAIGTFDGIASKRSIFEKDSENTAKSNISRKDPLLSGSVTSRIDQWSNKVPQSSSTSMSTKDLKTGDVATKRMLWQQRSQSSSDTKL